MHAWGLTAVKPIQAEQFVVEYTGELIRLSVNSMRERLDSDSDYRFRVDDQWVVDATTKVCTNLYMSMMLHDHLTHSDGSEHSASRCPQCRQDR